MNASHTSCRYKNIELEAPVLDSLYMAIIAGEYVALDRDLYDCSCPELEELTKVMRDSGAIGARLTGAGWGGCAVAIIKCGDEDSFMSKVKSGYYRPRIERGQIMEEDIDSYIFASRPSAGAAFILS